MIKDQILTPVAVARQFGLKRVANLAKPLKEITLISRIERALGRCASDVRPAVED